MKTKRNVPQYFKLEEHAPVAIDVKKKVHSVLLDRQFPRGTFKMYGKNTVHKKSPRNQVITQVLLPDQVFTLKKGEESWNHATGSMQQM